MRKTIVMGISAVLLLGLTAPLSASAAAPSQFDDASVTVNFADLNIDNAAGAKVLYSRLQRASAEVCGASGTYLEQGSLARVAQAEQCYAETLDEAVSKIDSSALRQIHSS